MKDSYVVDGAFLQCSCGNQKGEFKAEKERAIHINHKIQGNIQDYKPYTHIPSFGLCNSRLNPDVIAANRGRHGQWISQPCRPAVTMKWMQGKENVHIDGHPALLSCSKNSCMWCGQITFIEDGQE